MDWKKAFDKININLIMYCVERNRPVKRKEVYPADSPNILPTDTSQVPQGQ